MSQQFKEQGGAATMDQSPLARRMNSYLDIYLNSEKKLIKRRLKAEKARKKEGRPHVVDYFHQVEDGYSHLASQVLERLPSAMTLNCDATSFVALRVRMRQTLRCC